MAILKGPKSSRPDKANIDDKFWDWDSDITYTYGENGWELPSALAPAPVAAAPAKEPETVAPKKTTRTKKTKEE